MEKYNRKVLKRGLSSVLLTTGLLFGSVSLTNVPFSSIEVSAATKTTYKTTASLNLRSTNSTNGKILLTIPKGKAVTYISKSGNWYKVKYNGKTGWVSSKYIKATKTATTAKAATTKKTTYTTTANLNMRSTYSTKGKVLLTIPKGKAVTYISKSGNWFKVKYKGKTGWVSSKYIKKKTITVKAATPKKAATTAKTATTTKTATTKIATTSTAAASTSKNTSTKTTTTKTVKLPAGKSITSMSVYTTDSLNLRSSNSASSNILVVIPENTKLTTKFKTTNGWYQVSYKGKTGFVSGSYLIDQTEKSRINSLEKNKNSYIFMDLRKKSSVSAKKINNYIKARVGNDNSVLLNKGDVFIEVGEKYGVNALYLAAHAIHESNFGRSQIARERYNLFGFGAYDLVPYLGSVKFGSIKQNIEFIAKSMKSTYLGNDWRNQGEYLGYSVKSLSGSRVNSLSKGMNFYYATDQDWGQSIARHMTNIMAYSEEKATKRTANTTVVASPSYPNLSDVFSTNTLAIAKSKLSLYDKKNGKIVGSIPKGAKFNLLEKDNNYWLTVKYNKKTYYTNVAFNQYNKYFTVKNLARVIASELNVRKTASASAEKVGTVKNKDYIELALDKNNAPYIKNGWYKIVIKGGYGWVSGSYIVRELNK